MKYYSDERINIRDIEVADINALFRWWIDPEVNKFDPRPVPTSGEELLKEVEWFCKRFKEEIISTETPNTYDYFIITNKENIAIGFINLFNKRNSECELGIVIGDKQYHRLGIGTTSLNVITDYIFNHKSVNRIYIETLESNCPAISLFKKLDFKPSGHYLEEEFRFLVMEKYKE